MENMYFARDGSASALAGAQLCALGFVGIVRFAVDSNSKSALRHECVRHRDTREEALDDARADAQELVRRWAEERVHIDDL